MSHPPPAKRRRRPKFLRPWHHDENDFDRERFHQAQMRPPVPIERILEPLLAEREWETDAEAWCVGTEIFDNLRMYGGITENMEEDLHNDIRLFGKLHMDEWFVNLEHFRNRPRPRIGRFYVLTEKKGRKPYTEIVWYGQEHEDPTDDESSGSTPDSVKLVGSSYSSSP